MSSTQDEFEGRQVFQDLFRYDSSYKYSKVLFSSLENSIRIFVCVCGGGGDESLFYVFCEVL